MLECRLGCGACCIAPSISTPIPGMPQGKPAGERCIQLDDKNLCRIFGQPDRPAVCLNFKADADICGEHNQTALDNLIKLETLTS
ncbi:YkgJ family cysteine cluster protein [Bacterioplanoides sp.]|uniref:YkgJ family cysteine cluster protein n=1 Tax=Bacterioplanoides sp. TaxID=2066072 RepID=UPI003AFF82D7